MEREPGPADKRYSIRAVKRVCGILSLIQEHPQGFSLNQVADVTELPKSSAYRYLTTLEEEGYVMRDLVSGLFRIGTAFLPLQSQQLALLGDRVRPYLVKLRDEFDETANLGMLDGSRVSYAEIIESPHSVRLAARPGDRDQLHCTALGKAIAATLDLDRVKAILAAEGMPERTPATITTLDAYLDELEKTRTQGYALDDGENERDGRCIAVSLAGLGLPASISLSAPATRLPVEDVPRVAEALNQVAAELMNQKKP
ncbi:IclR family transcriptional regulator [Phytoactinopolyspora alkaliphila]|uniref:Glycerol operon regulatory protein n=1 Tax=Phytoactinopolyspora alkaliphila TaxID=1783498 RepID=A0A6N9YIS2_9ACTN|nr:IclR family transcriptional regulator [Phytoactinopolyspora alkaliphila]NED94769.1 IclR family transcriptional regulator [Phytoactinopolyspora alkaliphila]